MKKSLRFALALAAVLLLVVLVGGTVNTASAAGPWYGYYVVRPGDTLFSIAWRHGVSVWALAQANGLYNPNYIYYGQVLRIPPPSPAPGPVPGCFYTVRWGDTLASIAWRFGTTWYALAYANGLHNANYIYAGQVLRLPHCGLPQ
jgi:putative chitinase